MFNAMHEILSARGWAFHVHFMAQGHRERPDAWRNPKIDFPHTYWPDCGHGTHHFNPSLLRHLRSNRPDVLLAGSTFDTFTSIFATYFCRAKTMCAWSEGNTKTTGKMDGFKGWLKREIFSHYAYIGVPGSDAVKYVALHQAMTRKRMPKPVFLPNIVDETRFRPREEYPQDAIAAMRAKLGIRPGTLHCFIPARLSPVKGLAPMIELLEREWLANWRITILGQGELHDALEALAKERNLADKIAILPYLPYDEMPLVYAASDMMMLPSLYDPNPLSVVEALHCSLPVALSTQAGNVEEGVADGGNGWRLPVLDKEAFKAKLEEVFSADAAALKRMGRVSHDVNAQFWNTRRSITAFLDAVGAT